MLRAWLEHIFSSLYCPSPQRAELSVHTLVATVSRGGSGWEKDAAKTPRSSVHALQDGHAAMITGAALQRWLLLHAARCGVKSECFVRAFPVLISAAQDVNLPSAHRQATALLESRRKAQELRNSPPALCIIAMGSAVTCSGEGMESQ